VPLPTVIEIVNHLNDALQVKEILPKLSSFKERVFNLPICFQVESADPVFSNHPVHYPLTAVPSDLRNGLHEMLSWAGRNSFQAIYERLLKDNVYGASRGK